MTSSNRFSSFLRAFLGSEAAGGILLFILAMLFLGFFSLLLQIQSLLERVCNPLIIVPLSFIFPKFPPKMPHSDIL